MRRFDMKLLVLLATKAITSALAQDAEPGAALVQLTESNIGDLVLSESNNHDWLVMFGAPWCKWCQQLEPELIKAAEEHPLLKFHLKFAKADCSTEKSFNSRFDIDGYPTLKLFRDGIGFNAGMLRNSTQIDEYIHRIVTMPVLRFSPQAMSKEFRSDPYFIMVGNQDVMEQSSPIMERFTKAAWRMLPQFIRCYRLYEDGSVSYIKRVSLGAPDLTLDISNPDSVTFEDMLKFMQDNQRPLVAEVKVDSFKDLVRSQMPWAVLAIHPNAHQTALDTFRKAAASKPDNVLFVWIDSAHYPDWLRNFGADEEGPSIFMYDPNTERHWRSSNLNLESEHDVLQFIADVKDGKVQTMGPGKYHPAYLLRRFYQWITSSFYDYKFSYELAVTAFCLSTTLVVLIWFCIRLVLQGKHTKQKQQ